MTKSAKIKDIINYIEIVNDISSIMNLDICNIEFDSRKISKGDMFVCLDGENVDGHIFAKKAEENGASVIVAKERTESSLPHIIVKDTSKALSIMCQNYFGNPAKKLKLIGITGTNGKTTVSWFVKSALDLLGKKVGIIGTTGVYIGNDELSGEYRPLEPSTPSAFSLNKIFEKMLEENVDYVVMEATSQGLAQDRLFGLEFEIGAFTNLTMDHLDYHKTMENYFNAKKMLFDISSKICVNIDDEYGKIIAEEYKDKCLSYSINQNTSDIIAKNVRMRSDGCTFELLKMGEIVRVTTKTPGLFNVYNMLTAIGILQILGVSFSEISKISDKLIGVKGRCEVVPINKPYTVIIDYAHTDDGIINITKTVRDFTKGDVITVFGCGGDRDKTKRPLMAKASAMYSDFVIVTSDNPRSEDPDAIIGDIITGFKEIKFPVSKYKAITDRTKAIEFAINKARKDDVIILAGKGHETYQILKDKTIHYDEREIVHNIIEEK